MELRSAPSMETGMLMRRPVAEVFEAFVDPAVTSRFWFSKGSARAAAGRSRPLGLGDVRRLRARGGEGDPGR